MHGVEMLLCNTHLLLLLIVGLLVALLALAAVVIAILMSDINGCNKS